MIILDTHIWIWWVDNNAHLTPQQRQVMQENQATGLGVRIISCGEIAKLVELERLKLAHPIKTWLEQALAYPGIQLLNLTPEIVITSTQLPGSFHRDPADQLIVATAIVFDCPLLTVDAKIMNYPHVKKVAYSTNR